MKIQNENFLIQSATILAIVIASVLVISKGVAWHYSNAVSIRASLIDSLLDGLISLINFFAIRHAMRPADLCHRFGHEKAEALASIGQSVFIVFSAIWLLKEIIEKIIHPYPVIISPIALWVMLGSTILTIGLVTWQSYVIKKTKSLTVQADSLHYKSDILTNIGVIITIVVSGQYNLPIVDDILGLAIVVYILYTSYKIAIKACDVLMDRELSDDTRNMIISLAMEDTNVLSVHDLRTRSSGRREFIQLHLVLNADITLTQAHHIADNVEKNILQVLPKADVLIHQDPFIQ